MSTDTEQGLRELFAADAEDAPQDVDLTAGSLRRARRTRRTRSVGAVALVAAAVVVGAVVETDAPGGAPQRPPAAAAPNPPARAALPDASGSSAPGGTGELRSGGAADCRWIYSPKAVAEYLPLAFDGTVVAIGRPLRNPSGLPVPFVGVTFRVNRWFRGGPGSTVTMDMEASLVGNADSAVEAYGIGTRLLVSGEPRSEGSPPGAGTAWDCGFTRYYDPQTAAEWAAATR